MKRFNWGISGMLLAGMTALAVSCGSGESGEEDINAQTGGGIDDVLSPPAQTASGVDRLPSPQLPSGQKYEVELADTVDFLDDHPDIASMDGDGKEFLIIIPKPGKKLPLGKGRILLSSKHAVAHWVDDVQMVDGKPRFKLRPAKLTEIFRKIDIDAEVKMVELPLVPQSKPGAVSSPLVLVDADGTVELTKTFSFDKTFLNTANLDASAKGELNTLLRMWFKAYYNWKATSADRCTFGASLRFESDADFDAYITAKANYSRSGESALGSGIQLGWSIGAVSGIIDLDLVLNYNIQASGNINAHLDAGYDNFMFKAGGKYVCGEGWTKIEDKTAPQWHDAHEVTAEGSVSATLYPALEAAILIYGLAGPEIAIGPNFTGTASLTATSSSGFEACVDLDAALRAEVNFVVDAFGLDEMLEHNFGTWDIATWNVFDDCWTYCPDGDPADGTVVEGGYCCVNSDCKSEMGKILTCKNNKCTKVELKPPS